MVGADDGSTQGRNQFDVASYIVGDEKGKLLNTKSGGKDTSNILQKTTLSHTKLTASSWLFFWLNLNITVDQSARRSCIIFMNIVERCKTAEKLKVVPVTLWQRLSSETNGYSK